LKKSPGKLNFASGGFGTPAHLVGELFKLEAKVEATHVPYQQLPQALQDVMGGSNDFMFVTTLPVVDLVGNGNLKALAVTSSKPLPAFKGVPTVAEQGFPQLAVEDWVGYVMRQGTPPEVVAKVNAAIKAMDDEDSAKYFPGGRVKFDAQGRRVGAGLVIAQWQNGVPVTVYPIERAVAQPIWPGR
jgi:tripartite-type tricarboxylate transporter receptor subunit TctC